MSAAGRREGRRLTADTQRHADTNPRAAGTNPRALGTNPHPGKSELTGQWRAAWRRLGRLAPEDHHLALRRLQDAYSTLTAAERRMLPRELAMLGQPPR